MKDDRLCRYFADPAWQRQLDQLRKKSLSGYANGVVKLTDATPGECSVAGGLMGRHFAPPVLRYKVSDFETALRSSIFQAADMADFWQRLDGEPLLTHRRQREARANRIDAFFAAEEGFSHGPAARAWLEALRFQHACGYQLLAPVIGENKAAANWLHWVCCALDRLERRAAPEALALCSNAVSTDPHTLDPQTPAGRLLLQALAHWQHCEPPARARQRLALLRRSGLRMDDISCFTVQRGLQLFAQPGHEHPAYKVLRQTGGFSLLTASQLEKLSGAASPTGQVFIVENQMLFSSFCCAETLQHPLVCTSGQLREASWLLLDLLAESGCEFRYAGDFDPEGISIADRLWQEYPERVHFWHMQPQDYEKSISCVALSQARLQQLKKIQCPALQPLAAAVRQRRQAGYQESLLKAYWEDLQAAPLP